MELKDFWYIIALEKDLKINKVFSKQILNEKIALYKDESGEIIALRDRCLHRASPLSTGQIVEGHLQCPYHGWMYDKKGEVKKIPSQGPSAPIGRRCAKKFNITTSQGYVYINLNNQTSDEVKPFQIPCFNKPGYAHIRLINFFNNNVTNCAENFVDIPHTTYVHPNIFRNASGQKMTAKVIRENGQVRADYIGEVSDFGFFNFFLNPKKKTIEHVDEFLMPNVTRVQYWFGENKHFTISSQSIPITDKTTLVYTDLTYNYGWLNELAKPLIRWQAQKIINQDIEILGEQMKIIETYGEEFQNSPCDIIHTYIEDIRHELNEGRNPQHLEKKQMEVDFWV